MLEGGKVKGQVKVGEARAEVDGRLKGDRGGGSVRGMRQAAPGTGAPHVGHPMWQTPKKVDRRSATKL